MLKSLQSTPWHSFQRILLLLLVISACVAAAYQFLKPQTNNPQAVETHREFVVGWVARVGWAPWELSEQFGIAKRWSDRYGLAVRFVQFANYNQMLEWFAQGRIDGVASMSLDVNTVLASHGCSGTAVLVGGYTNGNDAIISKRWQSVQQLRGQKVHVVTGSVSEYLLQRALESNGLSLSEVQLVPMRADNHAHVYVHPDVETMVTWNPWMNEALKAAGGRVLYDSSDIPHEINGALVVASDTLRQYPDLGEVLVGIWFETLNRLTQVDASGFDARQQWADLLGVSPDQLIQQLDKAKIYLSPSEALESLDRFNPQAPLWSTGLNMAVRFEYAYLNMAQQNKLKKP